MEYSSEDCLKTEFVIYNIYVGWKANCQQKRRYYYVIQIPFHT